MDFFNNLQDYFSTLSSQETLFFWLIAGLLFVIGLLIGLLIQNSRLKRYRAQYLITEKERADFESRALSAEGKLTALEKEVAALSREKVAVLEELEALKKRPSTSVDPEALRNLQDQLQLLRSENEQLQKELEDYRSSKLEEPTTTPDETVATVDVEDYLQAAEARFEAFEQRLQELSTENERLHTEIGQLSVAASQANGTNNRGVESPYGTPHQPIIGDPSPAVEHDGEPLVIRADITDAGVRTDDNGGMEVIVDSKSGIVVPVLPPKDVMPDDLKLINNIGPFLEKKLNERGIYTYEQIAQWSDADIKRITKEIGYIDGVIAKDDWVGQAASLVESGKKNEATSRSVAVEAESKATSIATKKKKELIKAGNLQIVEGIGPKIETILKEAGIDTLGKLATKTPAELREVLAAAGNRFKSHNPDTWPQQAQLAHEGKLEELKVLQDSM